MSNILGSLAQLVPAASILTTLYTCPANTTVALSCIFITNLTSGSDTAYLSVAPQGIADATSQYLYYGLVIDGVDTFTNIFSLSLVGGDVVRCMSGSGNLAFNLFGNTL